MEGESSKVAVPSSERFEKAFGFCNRLVRSTAGRVFAFWQELDRQIFRGPGISSSAEIVGFLDSKYRINVLDVLMANGQIVAEEVLSPKKKELRMKKRMNTKDQYGVNNSHTLFGLVMRGFATAYNGELQSFNFGDVWDLDFWLVNVRNEGKVRVSVQDLEAEQPPLPDFWPLLTKLPPGLGLRAYRFPHFVVLSQDELDKKRSMLFLPSGENQELVSVPFILMRADYSDPDNAGVYVAGKGANPVFLPGGALYCEDPSINDASSNIVHALEKFLAP